LWKARKETKKIVKRKPGRQMGRVGGAKMVQAGGTRQAYGNYGVYERNLPGFAMAPGSSFRSLGGPKQNIPVATMHLSECVARYGLFLTAPFLAYGEDPKYTRYWDKLYGPNIHHELPCIPIMPVFPSYKYLCIFRGLFNIGTAGTGFVALSPFRPASNYNVAFNDLCPILLSGPTYAGAVFPTMDTGVAPAVGVNPVNWTTPFLITDTTSPDKKFRNTFAGFRVSCSGALLNVAGDMEFYHTVDHTSLSLTGSSNFGTQQGFYTRPVDKRRQWHQHIWCPAQKEEYDYKYDLASTGADPTYILTTGQKAHHIGLLITGAPVGFQFRIEVVAGFESIGTTLPTKTINSADIVGMSMVQSLINPDVTKVMDEQPGLLMKMAEGVDISKQTGRIADAAVTYGLNYLYNRYAGPRVPAIRNGVAVVEEVDGVLKSKDQLAADLAHELQEETPNLTDEQLIQIERVVHDVTRPKQEATKFYQPDYYVSRENMTTDQINHPENYPGMQPAQDQLKRGVQTSRQIEVRPEVKISGRPIENKSGAVSDLRRLPTI